MLRLASSFSTLPSFLLIGLFFPILFIGGGVLIRDIDPILPSLAASLHPPCLSIRWQQRCTHLVAVTRHSHNPSLHSSLLPAVCRHSTSTTRIHAEPISIRCFLDMLVCPCSIHSIPFTFYSFTRRCYLAFIHPHGSHHQCLHCFTQLPSNMPSSLLTHAIHPGQSTNTESAARLSSHHPIIMPPTQQTICLHLMESFHRCAHSCSLRYV